MARVNVQLRAEIGVRQRAEEALQTERQQLLSIFDSIDEPVYVSDPQTHELLYINGALKKLFGEVTGQKCFRALQGQQTPCSFCPNDRIFGENVGSAYSWECRNLVTGRRFLDVRNS